MNFVQNHSSLNVLYTAALGAHTVFLLVVALKSFKICSLSNLTACGRYIAIHCIMLAIHVHSMHHAILSCNLKSVTIALHESSVSHTCFMHETSHSRRTHTSTKPRNMVTAQKQMAAVVLLALAVQEESNKIWKRRRFWCKSWLQRRDRYSDMRLLRELQEDNPDNFKNYLRMDETAFSELLTAVTPYIFKHDTMMRPAVSPKERLMATLRFLATGRQLEDLKFSTGISPQSPGKIIPEICTGFHFPQLRMVPKFFYEFQCHFVRPTCASLWHFYGTNSVQTKLQLS